MATYDPKANRPASAVADEPAPVDALLDAAHVPTGEVPAVVDLRASTSGTAAPVSEAARSTNAEGDRAGSRSPIEPAPGPTGSTSGRKIAAVCSGLAALAGVLTFVWWRRRS